MGAAIVTAGIDVGSTAVKIALVRSSDAGGRARSDAETLALEGERVRRRDPREVVDLLYARALERAGVARDDVAYLATTGEGELVPERTGHFYGMTAHARGAIYLNGDTRSVVDVGSLHARAMRVDGSARVEEFRMTSQCASGSGRFLENIARYLGVALEEIGELSAQAQKPQKVSGICAVLAETDVINLVSKGVSVPDVLKGIHLSMASRFVKLLRKIGATGTTMVTGGLAADRGLMMAMQQEVDRAELPINVVTHDKAAFAGALGAALWGGYRYDRLKEREGWVEEARA